MKLSAFLGVSSLPGIFCYDKSGELKAHYQGPVKIDVLLDKLLGKKVGIK